MSEAKKAAAKKAASLVEEGMIVGLGTGSTAYWAIQEVGSRVREGLKVTAVASSIASEEEARKAGIEIISFDAIIAIDLTIDGADEVDEKANLIKGGGGALLREKVLAYNSKKFIVIVDETKLVKHLGKHALPVEVIPFAESLTFLHLSKLAAQPVLRMKEEKPFVTDNGNWIIDCSFRSIDDIISLNQLIHAIPGVVETGLFPFSMVSQVIVGSDDGTTRTL